MREEVESTEDRVDQLLLTALGVLSIVFLFAVLLMLLEPYDTIMYVHYLWRREWIATAMAALAVLACLRVWSRPKSDRTPQIQRYRRGLDCLLLLNVAALPLLLFCPPIETGHTAPRPGAQVCRQYPLRKGHSAGAAGEQVNYLLYLPKEYTESRKWPLIVFLHGGGAIGNNLLFVRAEGLPNQIERGMQLPFIIVSPQSSPLGWSSRGEWNPKLLVELIDHLTSTLPVDRDRIYLTGISMGGYGTWDVASQYPDRFAAIVPLCGGGQIWLAKPLAAVPIWAFHGAKDNRVPLWMSQQMVAAVTKCGGHAKLTVYPNGGHSIDDVTYRNPQLYEWLLTQRRSRPQQQRPAVPKKNTGE